MGDPPCRRRAPGLQPAHLERPTRSSWAGDLPDLGCVLAPMPPATRRPADERCPQVRGLEDARPRRLVRHLDPRGDAATEVAALKARSTRDHPVRQRGPPRRLLAAGLVDEYRILVYPVILGSGKRLFRDEAALEHLRLVSTRRSPAASCCSSMSRRPTRRSGSSPTPTPGATPSARRSTPRRTPSACWPRCCSPTSSTRPGAPPRSATALAAAARPARPGHPGRGRALARPLVKSTGDGVLATFDAPTRALRCAFGLGPASRPSGSRPGRRPHRRSGAAGRRRRRHRHPHRGSRARRGRRRRHRRDAHGARPRHRHRPVFRPLGSVSLRGVPGWGAVLRVAGRTGCRSLRRRSGAATAAGSRPGSPSSTPGNPRRRRP